MAGPTNNPYRFGAGVGYRRDGVNRNYVRARNLDTQRGRWTSRDPIGFGGGLNNNLYVGNRVPLMYDPLGLQAYACKAEDLPQQTYGYCPSPTCGPDVTAHVQTAIARIGPIFRSWPMLKKINHCLDLINPYTFKNAWDMDPLANWGDYDHFGCNYPLKTCSGSVSIKNTCHCAWAVNYITFGVMASLCEHHLAPGYADIFVLSYLWKVVFHGSAEDGKVAYEWAKIGYAGSFPNSIPAPSKGICATQCQSADVYNPIYDVYWLPTGYLW